jgi:hypothetical protein
MGKRQKRKGYMGEHEVEKLLKGYGINAKRVPLSGSSSFQKGDILIFDGEKKLVAEVKRRKGGFKSIFDWLNGSDVLFFRSDRSPWIVVMKLETFVDIVKGQAE